MYCECDSPAIDVEHDNACRRCGRPVNFTTAEREAVNIVRKVFTE